MQTTAGYDWENESDGNHTSHIPKYLVIFHTALNTRIKNGYYYKYILCADK
jgi:hypothetical protein